jgi:hypothetical protein
MILELQGQQGAMGWLMRWRRRGRGRCAWLGMFIVEEAEEARERVDDEVDDKRQGGVGLFSKIERGLQKVAPSG